MKELYKSYSAYQLAGEESFIAWVMHGEEDEAWQRWADGDERTQNIIKEARQIILDISGVPGYELPKSETQQLWNSISSSIPASATKKTSYTRLYRIVIAAAAAIALLLWVTTRNQITTVLAAAGEQKEIALPESSQIQLNADSRIRYNENRFEKDRELTLEGEAFFRVHPGSRFVVKTKTGMVTVLGTSFNVISREGRFEVKCYTGKVKVENTANQEIIITPGQQCRNDERTHEFKSNTFVPEAETPDWTRGKFVFEDQPLKVVAEELERQYKLTVKLEPGLEELRYTGLFESGDLDTAVSLITWPLGLKSQINGSTVLIRH